MESPVEQGQCVIQGERVRGVEGPERAQSSPYPTMQQPGDWMSWQRTGPQCHQTVPLSRTPPRGGRLEHPQQQERSGVGVQ